MKVKEVFILVFVLLCFLLFVRVVESKEPEVYTWVYEDTYSYYECKRKQASYESKRASYYQQWW